MGGFCSVCCTLLLNKFHALQRLFDPSTIVERYIQEDRARNVNETNSISDDDDNIFISRSIAFSFPILLTPMVFAIILFQVAKIDHETVTSLLQGAVLDISAPLIYLLIMAWIWWVPSRKKSRIWLWSNNRSRGNTHREDNKLFSFLTLPTEEEVLHVWQGVLNVIYVLTTLRTPTLFQNYFISLYLTFNVYATGLSTPFLWYVCASVPLMFSIFEHVAQDVMAQSLIPSIRQNPTFPSIFISCGVSLLIVGHILFNFVVLRMMHTRRALRLTASVLTAVGVAQNLSMYDTKGAASILDSAEADECDPILAHTLRTILSNLDLYRPFIPSYLLQDIPLQAMKSGSELRAQNSATWTDGEHGSQIDDVMTSRLQKAAPGPQHDPSSKLAFEVADDLEKVAIVNFMEAPLGPCMASPTRGEQVTSALGAMLPGASQRTESSSFRVGISAVSIPDGLDNSAAASPIMQQCGKMTRAAMSRLKLNSMYNSLAYSKKRNPRLARLREVGFRSFNTALVTVEIPAGILTTTVDDDAEETYTMVQSFVCECVETLHEHDGVVVLLQPDRLVFSWNAFRPSPKAELTACKAAVLLYERLQKKFPSARIVIDAGKSFVGFVGNHIIKKPVIVGDALDDAIHLGSLTTVLDCPILVTENVAKKIQGRHYVLPVDVVELRRSRQTIFALLPVKTTSERTSMFVSGIETYNTAFSQLMTSRYSETLQTLQALQKLWRDSSSVLGTDIPIVQAIRLARLSQYFNEEREKAPTPYCRVPKLPWKCYEAHASDALIPGNILNQPDDSFFESSTGTPEMLLHDHTHWEELASELPSHTELTRPSHQDSSTYRDKAESAPVSRWGQANEFPNRITQEESEGVLSQYRPSFVRLKECVSEHRKSLLPVVSSVSDNPARDMDTPGESSAQQNWDVSHFTAMDGVEYHRSGKLLGSGATSEVYLGMQSDGSLVALKYVALPPSEEENTTKCIRRRRMPQGGPSKNRGEIEAVLQEVNMLSKLRNDEIVAYLGSALVGNFLVIITEFISGGSLAHTLESFGCIPVLSVKRYLSDILRGLQFLHDHSIIHRDIKPHNVLLMIDGQCKLTDFGAAAELSGVLDKNVTGTPLYMAPEACLGKRSMASDLWSVGIMTIELLTGQIPYTKEQRGTPFVAPQFIYRLGHDEMLNPSIPVDLLPSLAVDFVQQCLQRSPENRPSAEQLLKHAFLL